MESDTDNLLTVDQFLAKHPHRPYTSIRTLNGQVVLLDEHIHRLVDSAKLMGITIRDSEFKELEQQFIQIVNKTKQSDTMLVVVYGHDGFRIKKQDLRRPRIDSSGGCTVKIVRAQRDTPKAKSTEWALQRQLLVHPDSDVEEYIIEDGEGKS